MSRKPIGGLMRPTLILASGSPRRRELLEAAGWTFEACVPDVDEDVPGTPEQMVSMLCERKARAVAEALDRGIVLGADTLVAKGDQALGKPLDAEDAKRMLRLLSGDAHEVLTGVCLVDASTNRMTKQVTCTKVHFRDLTDDEIDCYIATGEPMDKAGAYAIQGGAGAFVDRIEGSYENVIGLPTEILDEMQKRLLAGEEG